jgi:acyl carrier protein
MKTSASSKPELIEQVARVLRHSAKIPAGTCIRAESRLVEDLGIDSLDLVAVVLRIQDEFDIVIDEDAVPNLCRVADLATCLAGQGGVCAGSNRNDLGE